MSRIALISPNMLGTVDGVNRIAPGHGIAIIGAMLRQAGHEVFIRDTALEGYENRDVLFGNTCRIGESDEHIKAWIEEISPDYLGVSVPFSSMITHAVRCTALAKEVDASIVTMLGGSHVNGAVNALVAYGDSSVVDFIRTPGNGIPSKTVDFLTHGECEEAIVEFIGDHSNGQDYTSCPGVVYWDDNSRLYVNPRPTPIADLDALPDEARDLMNLQKYWDIGLFHSAKGDASSYNVLATRGCPEQCAFCSTSFTFGRKVRWRDPEKIYREILQYKELYGITEIQFDDDNITANYSQLMRLTGYLKRLGLKWCTPNGVKVNYHLGKQREMLQAMKDSGCYQITFAVESGVQRILDDVIHKNLKLDVVKPTIQTAIDVGMFVHTFFIVGFPGETREEIEKTVAFAEESGADSFSLAIFTPLPGTYLYDKVRRENLWWDGEQVADDYLFTRSQIRVDGFSSAEELETWVEDANVHLNSLLAKRDPARFQAKYGEKATLEHLKKQT